MPFSVLGPIENNFFTKFHVGHKNGMPTATFKFSHFFVLILTVFPKNLVSPNLGQNSKTRPFLISKNSEHSTSGFRFGKIAFFGPSREVFGHFYNILCLNWAKQDFFKKRSKSIHKMKKFKSCRWHPIFVSHMKFCKKSYFNGTWHQKIAYYDQ